jgi:hypothetical protein
MLEELFVIDSNLARRQLTTFQACELALKKKPILDRIARDNMSLGGKGARIQTPLGRVDEQLATQAGTSKDTFYKAEQLLQAEQENPIGYAAKLAEDARDNKITVNKAYLKLRKVQARDRKKAELAQAETLTGVPICAIFSARCEASNARSGVIGANSDVTVQYTVSSMPIVSV